MIKTCSLFIAAFLVLFAGYYWFLHSRFEGWPLLLLSGLGSMGLYFLLAGFAGLFTTGSDKTLLENARKTKPSDGKKVAVSGTIQATGLTLCQDPITGKDCVAYEYKFQTHNNQGVPSEYSGYAMSGCAIRAPFGDVRLLSFPVLEAFPWEDPAGPVAPTPSGSKNNEEDDDDAAALRYGGGRDNAKKYIANTKFQEVGVGGLMHTLEEVFADEDGIVKVDLVRALAGDQFAGESFQQHAVRPGQIVSAIGKFSASKNGLLGNMGFKPSMNRLFPGDPIAVSKTVGGDRKVTLNFGLVFFLIMHAFLFVIYKYRYINATPAQQASELQVAIQNHDLKTAERMLDGGVDADVRDSFGQTALLINSIDPEVVALLIKHHADLELRDKEWGETALFKAVREGPPEVVKMLIQAGANVNAVSTVPPPRTPLIDAVTAGRPDIEKMLRDAGARDDRVTAANGSPIQPDDDVVATFNAYMDAIYGKDLDTMMNLTGSKNREAYNTDDFGLWQNVRIHHPDSISGYKNDKSATLRVEGPTPDGSRTAWWYQMSRDVEGKWIIQREWSEITH